MNAQYRDYIDDEPEETDPTAAVTGALETLLGSISFMDADERAQAGIETDLFTDARVETFEAAMLLTRDSGLVVRLVDGTEYQITVQRSK